ncbi:MAG: zf-HC2 domain-containing protein [Acidobacteriota bacterium]
MNDSRPPIPPSWPAAWRETPSRGDHLDDVTMAELLDGVLGDQDRQRAEEHLAHCPTCRSLANQASEALAVDPVATAPAGSPLRRRWLPLAAGLALIAVGSGWFLLQPDAGPTIADNPAPATAFGDATAALVERALAGDWPPLAGLEDLPPPAEPVLRQGSEGLRPTPSSPRWGSVRSTRPALRWWLGDRAAATEPAAPEPAATEPAEATFELLVVDQRDNLLLRRTVAAAARPDGVLEAAWPADAPELLRGALYAWKVNVTSGGTTAASAFVPFRVLSDSEVLELAQRPSVDPVADSLHLATLGLFDEALGGLRQAPVDEATREALIAAVTARKRLPPAP